MKVVVIGGGPAGMLSAISSAKNGNEVIILEKMNMLGKKILITGKGRCNITSSIHIEEFIKNIPGNGMFMYSSFNNFNNQDILNILKTEGVETKIERGNRIFPVSDKADDVRKALKDGLIKAEGIYKDSELIVFYGKSGYAVKMFHEQNCCEHVSVESIDNPDDIYTDTSFCRITESTNSSEDNGDMSYSYTWTFYNIQTFSRL